MATLVAQSPWVGSRGRSKRGSTSSTPRAERAAATLAWIRSRDTAGSGQSEEDEEEDEEEDDEEAGFAVDPDGFPWAFDVEAPDVVEDVPEAAGVPEAAVDGFSAEDDAEAPSSFFAAAR